MARIADLINETRAAVPAAPDRLILRFLQRAAGEFCRQTHIWRAWLRPINTTIGRAEYSVDGDGRVEQITIVKRDGVTLRSPVMRSQDMAELNDSAGPVRFVALNSSEQTVQIWPTPTVAAHQAAVRLYVSLAPKSNGLSMPDSIIEEFGPGIIAIAKARMLFDAPSQPWHNPKESEMQELIAAEWMARAKREQSSGGHADMRVRFRKFA